MRIQFWGVRGSLPTPQLPSQIQSKIAAILDRLSQQDIETPAARQRFLNALPMWLYGTVGGNTACVSVAFDDPSEIVVFDAGSGIRDLGIALSKQEPRIERYRIFFSHFHWDHIMGLPFFIPAFNPSIQVEFYSPKPYLEKILGDQMLPPYFPVPISAMRAKKSFHCLSNAFTTVPGVNISYKKMWHPQDAYAYRVDDGKHSFIYATDVELSDVDFVHSKENESFFKNVDLIVIDSQYTQEQALEKREWGHSSFQMVADFTAHWGIKCVTLFHHDPTYDDQTLFAYLQETRSYAESMHFKDTRFILATEGLEITL
ncbi:MAG: MBL fold metallo-hydrolase [Treponema sp.]|jgi:phosphoribosyl 1,2-cyclic phosphodiesterase|nr:MBL fold metallo-hydrolase [Treponema sp.]